LPAASRKQQLTTQASELEALEARIREMDERLRRRGGTVVDAPASPPKDADTAADSKPLDAKKTALQHQHQHQHQQNHSAQPGQAHMPPTPSASEGLFTCIIIA